MKRHLILLTVSGAPVAPDLAEILQAGGMTFSHHQFCESDTQSAFFFDSQDPNLIAVVLQLPVKTDLESLVVNIQHARARWPQVPLIGCLPAMMVEKNCPDRSALERAGFRAVAENPAQLPALLREVEENPRTDPPYQAELFRSLPGSELLALPESLPNDQLHEAFVLIASLHFVSDQKEAATAAIDGVARLVPADGWTIFAAHPETANRLRLALLATRNESADVAAIQPTTVAQLAMAQVQLVKRTVARQSVIAVPLVCDDRLVGILEGTRARKTGSTFSRSESVLLSTLAQPIAAALANSVRVADAERLSLTDELTRLHNARYLRQFLVTEIKRPRRYHSKVAALFLDLDDFKRINDRHGHLVGSHTLMEFAAVVLPSVRDTDCVVRYGGDEFVVILPETGLEEAVHVAERVRAKIEQHCFRGGRRLTIGLTSSIGVAIFPDDALSPHQLIACADRAMYEAKAANKNCVRVASRTEMSSSAVPTANEILDGAQFQRIPDEKFIS